MKYRSSTGPHAIFSTTRQYMYLTRAHMLLYALKVLRKLQDIKHMIPEPSEKTFSDFMYTTDVNISNEESAKVEISLELVVRFYFGRGVVQHSPYYCVSLNTGFWPTRPKQPKRTNRSMNQGITNLVREDLSDGSSYIDSKGE